MNRCVLSIVRWCEKGGDETKTLKGVELYREGGRETHGTVDHGNIINLALFCAVLSR